MEDGPRFYRENSPDSSSATLRGLPDFPGVTRRPSNTAISSENRVSPSAKLPLVAC